MKSITYYLTLFVIKLKGLKKVFSEDPINYQKLRKEDVHEAPAFQFRSLQVNSFRILKTRVTEVVPKESNDYLLLFIHGGAYVYGPASHHWSAAKQMSSKSGCRLWMIDYPKAPEHEISEISKNIDEIYQHALEKFSAEKIIIFGDSVGGSLSVSLVQRLLKNNLPLPLQLFLVSPVMDASFSNPEIDSIEERDPVLSRKGASSAKKMCSKDLKNPAISPLYGPFNDFPPVMIFVAENDITYPDQLLSIQKMQKEGVTVETVTGKGMPHIWPILPVMKEGKQAFKQLLRKLDKITASSNS